MPEVSEEELFAQAIELPTEARAAFLEEACGDYAALKAGVEELLEGHETFSGLLDIPLEEREEELSEVLSEAKAALSVKDPAANLYEFELRGSIKVKGKGELKTYLLRPGDQGDSEASQ